MSCWWSVTFSVVGPDDEIERFREGLPELRFKFRGNMPPRVESSVPDDGWRHASNFLPEAGSPIWHHAEVKVRTIGFLSIVAGRNYYAHAHIEQMVAEFPNLTFVGIIYTDSNEEMYWTFDGANGESAWQEHPMNGGSPAEVVDAA
jgi:hypothetical protein